MGDKMVKYFKILPAFLAAFFIFTSCKSNPNPEISFILDNNRMLVDAEIRMEDGSFRSLKLWVDTGNPDFFISRELALATGILNPADSVIIENGYIGTSKTPVIRIGDVELNFAGTKSYIVNDRPWLLSSSGADANLPSTVLCRYDVSFDYPARKMTISEKGTMNFTGSPVNAFLNDSTGIIQVGGLCFGDSISFALDFGASCTFGSTEFLNKMKNNNSGIKVCSGTAGCGNIWGWSMHEESWTMSRIPQIELGGITLDSIEINIPPDFNSEGYGLMDWYSTKTARQVEGFLGPNAFLNFCVGLDYQNEVVYLDQKAKTTRMDMDIIGIAIRRESDGNYSVVGSVNQDGIPKIEKIKPGDRLLKIDDLVVRGLTMGRVIDALRGVPGEYRKIIIERNGKILAVPMRVERYL